MNEKNETDPTKMVVISETMPKIDLSAFDVTKREIPPMVIIDSLGIYNEQSTVDMHVCQFDHDGPVIYGHPAPLEGPQKTIDQSRIAEILSSKNTPTEVEPEEDSVHNTGKITKLPSVLMRKMLSRVVSQQRRGTPMGFDLSAYEKKG